VTQPDPTVIPLTLRALPHWVCWQTVDRAGKATKVPIDAKTGAFASVMDSTTWSPFAIALAAADRFDGLGFVLTGAPPFVVGVDLDACRDPETGVLHPTAQEIIGRLGTYAEVSPSGRGVHCLGLAEIPADHPCRTGTIEVYSRKRFLTVTGWHLEGTPGEVQDITRGLYWLFKTFFATRPQPASARPRTTVTMTDHMVIEKALAARNGVEFAKLWEGDWQAAGYMSQSEADLALLSHLAFWTNGDAAQMERLFAASGLARPKWVQRADYRARTLARALAGVGHA